jgi:26S proteasome regulatory subunit N9
MLFDEKYMLATDMALAAVCGDNLFNFGEIVTTPILSCLKDTPNQWLYELVLCMNDGDINIFNNVINTHKDLYYTHPALVNCHQKIQQKIVLLALLNMIFKRPSFDRCVSYQDIAKVAQIPLEQVFYYSCLMICCYSVDFMHSVCCERWTGC